MVALAAVVPEVITTLRRVAVDVWGGAEIAVKTEFTNGVATVRNELLSLAMKRTSNRLDVPGAALPTAVASRLRPALLSVKVRVPTKSTGALSGTSAISVNGGLVAVVAVARVP